MEKHFNVTERTVTVDETKIIAGNADYEAVFDLDDEWNGKTVIACFKLPDGIFAERLLEDGRCQIPVEILVDKKIQVGLYTDDIATEICEVPVEKSIKDGRVAFADLPKRAIEQILAKISAIFEMLEGLENGTF